MSVCIPCTRAGIYTSSARNTSDKIVYDTLIENARNMHSACLGGNWCDCQHSVNTKGELNMTLIAASANADSG